MNDQKRAYEAPSIEVLGTLAELTRGGSSGDYLDESFPAGTAFTNLTFS